MQQNLKPQKLAPQPKFRKSVDVVYCVITWHWMKPQTPDLGREATEEAEPEVHHGEGKILVKEVAEESAHAQIGPATVNQ